MKTKRSTKIFAAFLAMILFISSWMVSSEVHVTQAAGKKSRVVTTQAQLEKALKSTGLKKVVIQTKNSKKFSIPKGDYKGVDLVVKAPDADVVNRGTFKQITIATMKSGVYTEAANDNSIRLIASKAALEVQKGYTVKKLTVAKKCAAAFVIDGGIGALHVNARSDVKIKGKTGSATVYINKGGKKSTVETELALTLRLSADADIVLNEGGADSRIIVTKKNVSYSIKNNTARDLALQTSAGKKTLAAGKVYSGKTSEKTPGGGIVVTGGGSSGGGSSSVTGGRTDYTRGEWISLLSRSLGFSLTGSVQESLYYFSDTQGKAYGEAAELAQAYGLLPESDADGYKDPDQDVPMFEADKKVTREYATYTVVKALGYLEEGAGKPACGDQASLKYEAVDAIGISQGIIELKDGKFLPEEVLSKKDADAMLARMDKINASAKVTEPVDDVKLDENRNVVSIDYAGVGVPDAKRLQAAEGVRVSDGGARLAGSARSLLAGTDSEGSGAPGRYTFTLDNKTVGGVPMSGTVMLDIPDITCKIKAEQRDGKLAFDEFLLAVTNETKVDANLTYGEGYEMTGSANVPKNGTLKLAEIPCRLGDKLSVELTVSLVVNNVAGDVKVSCSIGGVQGIQSIGGQQRIIREFHQSLEELKAKGSFAVGTKLDCALKAGQTAVAYVSASTGFDGRVSYVQRPDGNQMYCGNGKVCLYASMKIPQGSEFGAYLSQFHRSETWRIFDRGNSPFVKTMHFENMEYQPNGCTYGKGSLEGTVVNVNSSRIIGAKVELMKDGEVLCHAFSDGQGRFSFVEIGVGTYTLKVKATGSFAYEMEIEVKPEKRYVELCIMLDRDANAGEGTIKGEIIDATDDKIKVSNVSYTVRKNWNNTTGEAVTSGTADGAYELKLAAGNYTIRFEAAGFVECDVNVAVIGGVVTDRRIGLAPTLNVTDDLVRVILTWGEHPEDLDSHLVGNTPEKFHIYFGNRNYPKIGEGDRVADLDLDDITSFGPETVTFYKVNEEGTFSYYVQDYTNLESKSSNQLSLSGAQVRVYVGARLVDRFYVPGNAEGILWHVFDFDMKEKKITPRNVMSYGENDEYIMQDIVFDEDWDEEEKKGEE